MPKTVARQRLTSSAQEDYLKALYRLAGETGVVPNSVLAGELGISPASASEMLSRLAALKLVRHDPYRGARLTPAGAAVALEILRHHRLLETYLVEALGYSWDEVHQEAERLEHAISERMEERMWEVLGRPQFDPHGDPIPARDGTVARRSETPLQEAKTGRATVTRISDREADKLREIRRLGLMPGTPITIVAKSRWEGPVLVRLAKAEIAIPLGLAREVFVNVER